MQSSKTKQVSAEQLMHTSYTLYLMMSLMAIMSLSFFSKSERNRTSSPAFVLLSLLSADIA